MGSQKCPNGRSRRQSRPKMAKTPPTKKTTKPGDHHAQTNHVHTNHSPHRRHGSPRARHDPMGNRSQPDDGSLRFFASKPGCFVQGNPWRDCCRYPHSLTTQPGVSDLPGQGWPPPETAMPSNPQQNRKDLASFRQRQRDAGLVRVEVFVPRESVDEIKRLALALRRKPGTARSTT